MIELDPIGVFRCGARHPYDAARQPSESEGAGGRIELEPGHDYEQALRELDGFSHVWVIYLFDRNPNWKPMVQPPRANRKVGVFASRSPHRPNPIGMSCVELVSVEGRMVYVGPHDLLDGTPVLDLKPYLTYADSRPDAVCGWVDALQVDRWELRFMPPAEEKLAWLEAHGAESLRPFLQQQLAELPTDTKRKRIRDLGDGLWEIAYRTWRVQYELSERTLQVYIGNLGSGYTSDQLHATDDPHEDKALHRDFIERFH